MLILLSPEKEADDEIDTVNGLFEAGLSVYHLRKPHKTYQEHCQYLDQIHSEYHHRIVVHFFDELLETYDLKGVHFKESQRNNDGLVLTEKVDVLKKKGKTVSSAFHHIEDLLTCPFCFDYHLLSPVFSSISKKGYQGKVFNVNGINKVVIGMGGITPQKIPEIVQLGFSGIAVLGAVWQTVNPVASFAHLKNKYNLHYEKQT